MTRLTVAQAAIRFLTHQYVERDQERHRLLAGVLGIFGHGNVAGLGQALLEAELEDPAALPYLLGRNEQAMVHTAVAYARARHRLQVWACTSSVGPGATNMVTGAALATVNRLPVLLMPSDSFATRSASPLLQELEHPQAGDVTVNDCFRPVSRYFDRVWRPEQLPSALLGAVRVLTDPVDTGAATICFPEDVQAQAYDWPDDLFCDRTWRVARPQPEPDLVARAAQLVRGAQRPLLVVGGGVHYSGAVDALRALVEQTGIPVGQTQAGRGALLDDEPACLGAIGATGTTAANWAARQADLVIAVGTRLSDFTTASRTLFAHPEVQFIGINVAALDAVKHAALPVLGDARDTVAALTEALTGYQVDPGYRQAVAAQKQRWAQTVAEVTHPAEPAGADGLMTQNEVIALVNEACEPSDVVVCAAGSMPGDLHKMWQVRDPDGYHVEYGYSCMGYEIAGGLGVKLAQPEREVVVMVGDGSYLMLSSELATAVQEGVKLVVVIVQNHGFASIGALSESVGSQRFGTAYRQRTGSGRLDGDRLPVDLAANARSFGVDVIEARSREELTEAVRRARAATRTTVVHVTTDPLIDAPPSEAWWEVPVAEVASIDSTREARRAYEQSKQTQRAYLRPTQH